MYLRLDKDLAQFLTYLDGAVGKGQYVLFLSADHGAAHIPAFLQQHHIPAGALDDAAVLARLNVGLQKTTGAANLITTVINYQVYLNDAAIAQKGLNKSILKQQLIDSLLQITGVANAIDLEHIKGTAVPEPLLTRITNGYNQKLSGDIQFVCQPQWFDGGTKGTTHGAWSPYDAHIPLLWFGWGIKPGSSHRTVYMTDIAPTVAALLNIQMPSATIGNVIEEVLK